MKSLYTLLKKHYKSEQLWKEVETAFKEEGIKMNMNDFYHPFKNLIIGILSQNTSDRNSTKAWIGLSKEFKITPKELANASLNKLSKSIKPGGLYNIKAKRIKEFSKTVLKRFNGDLSNIANLPKEKAREALISIKGIGVKTADVFLAYCMNKDALPVDTNIDRVAKRVGIVKQNAKYKEIQEALIKIMPKNKRARSHELLIRLGRDFCKSRNPLCKDCPITKICKKTIEKN